MTFELHKNLVAKDFIADLPLCRVLLEDNKHYPWIYLVPRRNNISRMSELPEGDQKQLMIELDLAQKIMWKLFEPTQLNVAAIGNKTPQLHIHVIARRLDDPAWPGVVWDHPAKEKYLEEEKNALTIRLRQGGFHSND